MCPLGGDGVDIELATAARLRAPVQTQLLTTEYVPILITLILYIHVQAAISKVEIDAATQLAMAGAVFGRYTFALRHSVHSFDIIGAVSTYIAFGGVLAAAAAYSV